MKSLIAPLVTGAAALGLAMVTASVAMAGPTEDADAVISDLKAHNYRVIVTKVGSDHPSKCTVQSVNRQSASVNVQPGRNMRNQPTTVPSASQPVAYVTLAC